MLTPSGDCQIVQWTDPNLFRQAFAQDHGPRNATHLAWSNATYHAPVSSWGLNNGGWSLRAIFYRDQTSGDHAYVAQYGVRFGLTVIASNVSAARAFARPFLSNVSGLPPDSWDTSLGQLRQEGSMGDLLMFSTNVSGPFHLPPLLEGAALAPDPSEPRLERGPWKATVDVGWYHLNATEGWVEVDAAGAAQANLPPGDVQASIAAVLQANGLGPTSFSGYTDFPQAHDSCDSERLRS